MIDTSSANQKYSTIHHYQPVASTHSIAGNRQQVSTNIISTYHQQISNKNITHRHIISKFSKSTADHSHMINILSRHHPLGGTFFGHHVKYQVINWAYPGRLWDGFSVASRDGVPWWFVGVIFLPLTFVWCWWCLGWWWPFFGWSI